MIYRIYKVAGHIGTEMEKTDGSFMDVQNSLDNEGNRISLAAFDKDANTIHVFNDKIIDVSSMVQKFKNHCDLPNNHKFNILHE